MSWSQPPPVVQSWPPPARRRFAGWFVVVGVVAAPIILIGADRYLVVSVLYFGCVAALLIGGIVLACLSGLSPTWRGFGLGIVIGWIGHCRRHAGGDRRRHVPFTSGGRL